MSILEQLRAALPELSKNERKVAEYFLQYPYDARRFSCESVAHSCNTSRSAVIRLCQKLGYKGYAEFKYALAAQPAAPAPAADTAGPASVLELYAGCIRQLEQSIQPQTLSVIAEVILRANRVVTLGINHSMLSAQQMAFRLNRLNIDSHAIDDESRMENYMKILKQGDVVLIFSISAQNRYVELVREYRRNRAVVILITMTPGVPLAREADYVLALPFISHSYSPYLLDDAITFFLAIEMMLEAIGRKLNLPADAALPEPLP